MEMSNLKFEEIVDVEKCQLFLKLKKESIIKRFNLNNAEKDEGNKKNLNIDIYKNGNPKILR